MATDQIPRVDWLRFFDDFTKKHEGKKASAQLYGQGVSGTNDEATALTFVGVTYEEKGSDADAVRIMLGDSPADHITHAIPSPTQVWLRPRGDAGGEMLEIHGGDGQTLILKLKD